MKKKANNQAGKGHDILIYLVYKKVRIIKCHTEKIDKKCTMQNDKI